MDEITRHPYATDADPHTDRPAEREQREGRHEEQRQGQRDDQRDGQQPYGAPGPLRSDPAAPGPPAAGAPATDPPPPGAAAAGTPSSGTPTPAAPTPSTPANSSPAPADPPANDAAGPFPEPAEPPGLAALLRLAVLCVDPDGRISYWNRGAEELFGHRWEHVFGQPASGLLSEVRPAAGTAPRRTTSPQQDVLDVLDDLTHSSWAGALAATDRDGTLKDVLWWTYRLDEPGGRSLLAVATHAKPLRTGSLRIALGGRMLPYTAEGPQRQDIAVAAVLTPPGDPAQGRALAARLGSVLPGVSPGRLERIVQQIAALGHPALEVEGGTRLPVVPHDYARLAAAARAEARRAPRAAAGSAAQRTHRGGHRGAGHGPVQRVRADRRAAAVAHRVPGRPRGRRRHRPWPRSDPAGPGGGGARPEHAGRLDPPASGPRPHGQSGPATPTAPVGLTGPTGSAIPNGPVPTGNALDEQLALLRETGAVVGSTLDLGTTARELCPVTVPRFADFASVLVVDQLFSDTEPHKDDRPADTVLVRRVATAHHATPRPLGNGAARGRAAHAGRAGADACGLATRCWSPSSTRRSRPTSPLDLGVPALGPLLGGHSLIVAPLTARGTVLGRVCFLRGPGRRPFDERDVATAAEFAARGAVHIDNARLHRQESRAAATLQRSMMPTRPPRLPGVRIAHHYMPGDRQAQVGGDWFDAIQLPGGRVALIVGDVMGHGLPGGRGDGPVPYGRDHHGRPRPAAGPAAAPPRQPRPPARHRAPRHLRLRRLRPDPAHPHARQRRATSRPCWPATTGAANCWRSPAGRRSGWAGCRSRRWRSRHRTAVGWCCAPTGWSRCAARA